MKQHVLLRVLSAEADRDALRPILDALKEKGLRVSAAEGSLKKGEILLAALSGHFYADGEKQKTLLEALSTGAENVLPLKLDEAEIRTAVTLRSLPSACCRPFPKRRAPCRSS